jgi:hypothetical protein
MLISIGDDPASASARAERRPACGPLFGAGATQARQIAQPDARDRGINHLHLGRKPLVREEAVELSVAPRREERAHDAWIELRPGAASQLDQRPPQ